MVRPHRSSNQISLVLYVIIMVLYVIIIKQVLKLGDISLKILKNFSIIVLWFIFLFWSFGLNYSKDSKNILIVFFWSVSGDYDGDGNNK